MARMTLMNVPADQHDVVNAFLVGVFGDDPESDEIPPNAYVSGGDQFTATRSFCTIPLPGTEQAPGAMLTSIINYFASRTDCLVQHFPTSPSQNWWSVANAMWSILPVVQGV